ncbi:MAG: single-stranded-DNA-specific exonuclease RecJ [Bacteroidota bacterium]
MRWTLKPKPLPEDVQQLSKVLKVDTLIAQLLLQRGVTNYEQAKDFFRPQWKDLHDPFLMKDMNKAVSRIQKALDTKENILVYGDYDVDGTTSVALLSSYLSHSSSQVATYIPDRYKEGYGVSMQGIDFAADNDFTLIIALDCGIKALEQVAYAKTKGIDFIICDHHRPGPVLPEAIAILDPKREDCGYPFKELCGCGVGFKLIQALHQETNQDTVQLYPFLDLVATAIGADIVPITGENRVLAYLGLQVINTNPRPGFQAILENVKKKQFTVTDLVFILAPRINAAGRMKHGQHAVELLLEDDVSKARETAAQIEQFNSDRRNLDSQITEEALHQIQTNGEEEQRTTVVYDPKWHKGVIGIVASRLTETHYRPTLVFTKSGDKLAASARSVKGFDVYHALEACAEHIEQFGGHKYAAGLTLEPDSYDAFKQKFESVVSESIDPSLLQREQHIDMEIDFSQISPKLLRILKQFAPFGPGNMTPVFMARGLQDTGYGKCVGEGDKHLKLAIAQNGKVISAIGFGLGKMLDTVKSGRTFDAVFSLEENEWNGTTSIQLKLRDIR